MVSETVHYKRGVSQQFSLPSFKINFSDWKEEDVSDGHSAKIISLFYVKLIGVFLLCTSVFKIRFLYVDNKKKKNKEKKGIDICM